MKSSELLVEEGKRAARAREIEEARQLLMQAIELDERNANAWLWLSGVVDTNEDRRICLDNVLTIDPDNAAAKKGLARLAERLTVPLVPAAESKAEMAVPGTSNSPTATKDGREMARMGPSIPLKTQHVDDSSERWTTIMLVLGVLFFAVAILIAGMVVIGSPARNDTGVDQLDQTAPVADVEDAVLTVMRENAAAMNAGDVARYMATIHTESPGYGEIESAMKLMVEQHDLVASWGRIDVREVGQREARVDFALTTRKISGPAFRDNRVEGEMILMLENGRWKIYSQRVNDISYLN